MGRALSYSFQCAAVTDKSNYLNIALSELLTMTFAYEMTCNDLIFGVNRIVCGLAS